MQTKLKQLLDEIAALLPELENVDLGYEKGENAVYDPLPEEMVTGRLAGLGVADVFGLKEFYCACNGLDLENVYNGYFIDGLDGITKSIRSNELSEIRGSGALDGTVVIIGGDGGGGRFAIRRDTGEMLYLPMSAVDVGVYDGAYMAPKFICKDIGVFLEGIRDDFRAVLQGDDSHEFLADWDK